MELPVSRFPENPKKAKKSQQTETDFGVLFGRSGAKPKTQTPHGFPDTNTCLRKEDALIWIFAVSRQLSSTVRLFFKAFVWPWQKKTCDSWKKIYRRLVDGWGPTLGSKPESRIKVFVARTKALLHRMITQVFFLCEVSALLDFTWLLQTLDTKWRIFWCAEGKSLFSKDVLYPIVPVFSCGFSVQSLLFIWISHGCRLGKHWERVYCYGFG